MSPKPPRSGKKCVRTRAAAFHCTVPAAPTTRRFQGLLRRTPLRTYDRNISLSRPLPGGRVSVTPAVGSVGPQPGGFPRPVVRAYRDVALSCGRNPRTAGVGRVVLPPWTPCTVRPRGRGLQRQCRHRRRTASGLRPSRITPFAALVFFFSFVPYFLYSIPVCMYVCVRVYRRDVGAQPFHLPRICGGSCGYRVVCGGRKKRYVCRKCVGVGQCGKERAPR